MGRGPSIVFASREVWPFVDAGIGRSVWGSACLLADQAAVTILTSERWQALYRELRDAGDARLPSGIEFAFAPEPDGDLSPYVSWHQAWSSRLLQRVTELFPDGGPDLVEVADYGGEGFAMAHARRAGDPRLRHTVLAVRLHTSGEICAELNEAPENLELQLLCGMERFPLAYCDVLLEPGGDVLERYAAHYGAGSLARAIRCPPAFTGEMLGTEPSEAAPGGDGPLRVLYLNRLERRKGIEELLTAVASLPAAHLTLTVVGGDTATGPDGGSMLEHCRRLVAGDSRVELRDRVPHVEVPALIRGHHLVAVPARWETFSYVTREALAANRPVLATPVGAIVDVVEPARSGWLARSSAPADLREALESVLSSREQIDAMIRDGLPRACIQAADNGEALRLAYRELSAERSEPQPAADDTPAKVTALVAVEPDGPHVTRTLRSLRGQRGAGVETVVVTSESHSALGASDLALVHRLVGCRGPSAGRIAAWISGAAAATHDLLLPIAAGTELGPDFVAHAAAALRATPELAYATAFVAGGREPWHAPAGNYGMPADADIAASVALIRGPAFADLHSAEAPPTDESSMFEELARLGHFGVVVQEPLVARLPRRSRVLSVAR